jgi:hypothetical protein
MEKSLVIGLGLLALGAFVPGSNAAVTGSNIVVWVEDALPAGAQTGADGGDSWNWVSSNPSPYSGSLSQQSSIAAGLHEHYFSGATQTLSVNAGDVLFAAVYIDPSNVPSEIMLQWDDGSWDHRAYWGNYWITYGQNGTSSSYYMGAIPTPGQWTLLTIPASAVGLEGSTVSGMAFSLFNGGANWDYAGDASSIVTNGGSSTGSTNSSPTSPTNGTTSTGSTNTTGAGGLPGSTNTSGTTNAFAQDNSTNALPGLYSVDDAMLQLPHVGDNALHILTPTLLEVDLITSKAADPAPVTNWNLVNASTEFAAPSSSALAVTVNGQSVAVSSVGFKRRPLYAPMSNYDLRVGDSLYLELGTPIADNQTVQVSNTDGTLWSSNMQFVSVANPLRYNPAIHVNQEGYLPNYAKQAMVGYYAGSLGEVSIPSSAGFVLVDANTGAQVFQGSLTARQDQGYEYSPTPYQQVYQADFSSFSTPGQYRLVIPGMGGSMPFRIDEGIGMCFARAYALGLYHQRCGAGLGLPYTRFAHAPCHVAPASVIMPATSANFTFSWTTISNYAVTVNSNNPPQIAPFLTSPQEDLFPFINQGTIDVSGGHHDAGDYSKYTINSASLVHYLMFEVDSLPGVAALDNLGIAESGDGISDVMQEAKWESDFLAKMQDADGGFYFLVYPTDREYESNVTPENGDPQVVWPKTMSVTAAATAALAQCASSPLFKQTYPEVASNYLQKAQLGWNFLTNAIAKHGYSYNPTYQVMRDGAYQKITAYGDDFADNDELAWAACEMFLATGDANAHQMLLSWFNPSDPATWRWGWWHMSESYGNCIRSYAFAVQSGRVASASQLNATFLAECTNEIATAGNNVLEWSQQSAYGTSFPSATKAVESAGWYFSADQAFDMVVAYQLNPNTNYLSALVANMNYEGGCNPVNACYIAGLGWKRQHGIVSQWELNDIRGLPPSGLPIGNIQSDFDYLWDYAGELEELSFPSDGASNAPYPFYDRWGDSWNVTTEMVVLNQARGLGSLAFLAAQTSLGTQAWQAVPATITVPSGVTPVGSNVTVSMQAPGLDLTTARITWEANGQQPTFGQTFTFAPRDNGPQWVEAEAQFPDGRRVFASNNFTANSPNLIWVEDSIPTGGVGGSDGGDSWDWVSNHPTPFSGLLAQQSAIVAGEHQVFFDDATATLTVQTNAVLYAWIYLDPSNTPNEAMLQWDDGSWEHRAYWGANNLTFGIDGTASRTNMGALPAAGQWAQLTVPASLVNLSGSTLNGLAFTLYGGRATWDCAGASNFMGTTSNSTITVGGSPGVVSRVDLTPGTITLNRSGNTSAALNVAYSLGGNATPGVDYQISQSGQSAPTISFPAGASSTTVTVTPLATTNVTGPESIVLSLGAGSSYSVGAPGAATISLTGNTIAVNSMQMSGGSPTFSWPGGTNAIYSVLYKNNLTDPVWLAAGSSIQATIPTTTWTDTNNAAATQRFYVVTQTQ